MRTILTYLIATALSVGVAVAQQPSRSVLTYHGALDRSGLFIVPGLTIERARSLRLDNAFQARFEGRVFAQPLFWFPKGAPRGLIIVATENDAVYALDALSGAQSLETDPGRADPPGRPALRQYFSPRRDGNSGYR